MNVTTKMPANIREREASWCMRHPRHSEPKLNRFVAEMKMALRRSLGTARMITRGGMRHH